MGQVNLPTNLIDRILELERRVSELYKRLGLGSATINQGGLTVTSRAFIATTDPESNPVFYAGPISPARPDGTFQPGVVIKDDAGNVRLALQDPSPLLNSYRQSLSQYDGAGNLILSDDDVSLSGLKRPYIPFGPPWHNRHSDWVISSVNATFESCLTFSFPRQHPVAVFDLLWEATVAGTAGDIELVLGTTQLYTHSISTVSSGAIVVCDVSQVAYGSTCNIELHLRRTAGTGVVRVEVTRAFGAEVGAT